MVTPPSAAHQRLRVTATLVAATLLLVGCAGPGAQQAGSTATLFAQQASTSPEQACELLSEQVRRDLEDREKTSCAQALTQLELPTGSALEKVDVYEQHARVVLGQDVVFLARFADGWRVTAAGCQGPGGDEPYDCELGG